MTLTKSMAGATALGVATLIGFSVPQAQAAYTLTIEQDAAGVTAMGSGSINFDGLEWYGDELDPSLIAASGGAVIVGPTTPTDDTYYSGITGSTTEFGPGGEFFADMGGGALVGLGTFEETSGGIVAVPLGYVSGASLGTTTAAWTGATIASLGLTPSSYVWTWGSGATADSFTLDIVSSRAATTPEPSTWAMMLLGLGGVALARMRRLRPAAQDAG